MWLGDVIYVDFPQMGIDSNMTSVVSKYNRTKHDVFYTKLRENVKIIGIYDDHDYGYNDADGSFVYKKQMKDIFLDFLDEPQGTPRRLSETGIYVSYYLGTSKIGKLIILDIRYVKTDDDLLGEVQWDWLEQEILDPTPEIFFISSGTQIIPDDRFLYENWGWGGRKSKVRLYNLIAKYKRKVIFLTGDMHFGEILSDQCAQNVVGYEILEVSSSGLNLFNFFMSFDSYDLITRFLFQVPQNGIPNTYSSERFTFNVFGESNNNYGLVEIIEEGGNSVINMSIFGIGDLNRSKINKQIKISDIVVDFSKKIVDCEKNLQDPRLRVIKHYLIKLIEGDVNALCVVFLFLLIIWVLWKIVCKIWSIFLKLK